MAAYAASALATTSEAALLAGKPGAGGARDTGADSPFAAMLAQMMSAANRQAAPATPASQLPANDTAGSVQSSTALAAREFAPSDRFGQIDLLQPAATPTPQDLWRLPFTVTTADQFNTFAQGSASGRVSIPFGQKSVPAASPGAAVGSSDSFAVLLGSAASTARSESASQQASGGSPVPGGFPASRFDTAEASADTAPHNIVLAQASTAPSALAAFTAGSGTVQSSGQQAASAWLRQMMGTGTNADVGASQTSQQNAWRLPASSWLQQATAPGNPASASAFASQVVTPSNLPSGVSSYSLPAGTSPFNIFAGSQPTAQQTPSSLSQQIIAASVQAGSPAVGASPLSTASTLPTGVGSYAQSIKALAQPFAGTATSPPANTQAQITWTNPQPSMQVAPSWLQHAMAAGDPVNAFASPQPATEQTSSPFAQQIIAAGAQTDTPGSGATLQNVPETLPSGVASYAQSIKGSSAQFADASAAGGTQDPHILQTPSGATGGAPASTILAAGSTQSVAAMFGVPSFPAAMAYATPGSGKFLPAQPSNASPSQEASLASHAGNAGTNAAASQTANAQALPQEAQQPLQQGTPQSFHALASADHTPAQAAVADSNKVATLAQAVQDSVRQIHPASATEAQALPLQFDVGDAKDISEEDGSRATQSDAAPAQEPADASRLASSAPPSLLTAPLQHAASPAPAAPSLPAGALNATQAPLPAAGAAQLPATAPAPMTQAAATLPAAGPAATLAVPDLNALAVSIAAKSLTGAQQFDIRMDPAELGRVDVRLSLDGNGTAQAHLAAERPETLTLLQNNAGALTRALQDSGVQVANNGLQFSLKGQERQSDGQPRASSRGRASPAQNIAAAGALNGATSGYGLTPSGSGVNILV